MFRRRTWTAIFQAVDFLLSNEIYTYASAIAFNAIIAFFPAVIVVLTLVNAWGGRGIHDAMLTAIIDILPANREFFAGQIGKVTANFSGMTLFSLGILLFSAVGIFVPVELALNYVWKESQARHWLRSQLISFGLLAFFIFVSIVPAAIAYGINSVLSFLLFFLEGTSFLAAIHWLVIKILAIPFTILGFAVVYRALPARRLALEEIVPAAVFSGVTVELGKHIYILALPLLGFREIYGAFFVSVTFITWALFASMIMLMGAYLTAQNILPRVDIRRRFGFLARGGADVPGPA